MATARAIKKMSGFKPKSKASRRASVIPRLAPSSAQTSGPAIKLTNEKAKKDSRFKKVMEKLQAAASKMRRHPPASQKAAEAQKASIPPVNERMSGAMANQVDAMNEAPAGKPKSESFLSMLRAEIRKVMPKKTKDAKDFMKGNDRENLQSAMTGNVNKQKDEASKGIQSASEEKPDESKVAGKEVEAIPRQPSPQPDRVDAAEAMPAPQPRENVAFTQEKQDGDAALKQNNLTTSQLDKANDSRFSAVVTSKGAVEKNAQASPGLYGGAEKGILGQAAAGAAADEKTMMGGMRGGTAKAIAAVAKRQLTAKEKDEAERKKVVDHLENIYAKTKAAVEAKLAGMEEEVTSLFDKGTDTAIERMKAYVENRFDKRYSGAGGALLWAKDKLLPLPDSVKEWFNEAQDQFASDLDKLVVAVANLVEKRLKEAKDMIAAGQKEIRAYVNGLPANLQDVGKAAEKEMAGRFDELRQGVDDKKNDLARKLAQKYKDASEKGAKALQDLKDKHKSLYEKLRDAIAEVVKILKEFKERVLSLLKKARDAIDIIVADPIGFLKNLLAAIKKGVNRFVDNIWTHLKQGFLAWLFGSLADAGIEIPGDFSLPSILHLVLQVLGLTYDRIRQKAVKLIGERNVGLIEKAWEFISAILKGGPAKIWENIKEYLGNLKETVISAIQEWVVSTIIKQAVIKLVSMFNPVGAIIQAIVMIYNTVMFLIENISRIMQFVEAVVESVSNIAHGAIDAAANWIEKALAKMVPIIIAFLARLLGLSGISDKIKEIIKKIQDKVDKAIDKVIEKVVGGIGKLFGKGKAAVGKIVEWWKTKNKFATRSGDKHSIYFEGDRRNAKLTIASSKKAYLPFIRGLNTNKDPEKQKAKDAAIETAIKIDSLSARVSTKDGTKEETEEFANLCKLLAEQTKIFMDRIDALPASALPVYGQLISGYGSSMTIEPLTKIGPPGTVPSASSEKWERLNLRREGKRSYYIRGHLLNHNIHGPGSTWNNLTPLSQKGNKNHLSLVEKVVKEAVKKGSILYYQVIAKFDRKNNQNIVAQLKCSKREAAVKEKIKTVIGEEQYIPSHLLCTANIKKLNKETGKMDTETLISKDTKVPNPIKDQDIKDYAVV